MQPLGNMTVGNHLFLEDIIVLQSTKNIRFRLSITMDYLYDQLYSMSLRVALMENYAGFDGALAETRDSSTGSKSRVA